MSEVIKLFGRKIPLPMRQEVSGNNETSASDTDATFDYIEGCSYYQKLHHSSTTSTLEDNSAREENEHENDREKGSSEKELTSDNSNGLEPNDPTISSGISENPKTSSIERETSSLKTFKSEEQSEISISQEKTLKKPENILPCPRCHSMDTKFCYFNNYNVSQPRHFCKNCQRYWTAGGSMRNVPIGAGRRKNKNSSASSYLDLVMSDPLRLAQANGSNGVYNPCSGINRAVLNFGSDSPLWESKTSVLNLAETKQNYIPNEFHKQAQRVIGSSDRGGKSITEDNGGFPPPQLPCFPGPPWSCPWNPVQWTPGLLPPAMYNSGFPISFYPPPAFWGSWNTCFPQSSTINHTSPSCPNSHTLGKHSRDGNIILSQCNSQREEPTKDNNDADRIPLIPKTLRINDPSEAAKSSIWATLGIKYDQTNYPNGGGGRGFVKAFQSKGNEKTRTIETSPFLQANPAALSRSVNFHERKNEFH